MNLSKSFMDVCSIIHLLLIVLRLMIVLPILAHLLVFLQKKEEQNKFQCVTLPQSWLRSVQPSWVIIIKSHSRPHSFASLMPDQLVLLCPNIFPKSKVKMFYECTVTWPLPMNFLFFWAITVFVAILGEPSQRRIIGPNNSSLFSSVQLKMVSMQSEKPIYNINNK